MQKEIRELKYFTPETKTEQKQWNSKEESNAGKERQRL